MNLEITVTNRGKLCIIHNNFKYSEKLSYKDKEEVKSWFCTNKNCSASLKTDVGKTVVLEEKGQHNHNTSIREIQRHMSLNFVRVSCKRKAEGNTFSNFIETNKMI